MKSSLIKITMWNSDRTKCKTLYIDRNAKKRQDRALKWDRVLSAMFTVGAFVVFVLLYYIAYKFTY